jgi:hypothetical protein
MLFAFYGARLVSVDDGIALDGSSGPALAFGVKSASAPCSFASEFLTSSFEASSVAALIVEIDLGCCRTPTR